MSSLVERHPGLDIAIDLLVTLGERDPLNIARKLIEEHGLDWAKEEVAQRAEDYIVILARQAVSNARRRAEANLVSGNASTELALRQSRVWIPNGGWKLLDDCTALDFLARADWYSAFIHAAQRREQWCREVAQLITDEGARTLSEVTRALPAFPSARDDIPALSA